MKLTLVFVLALALFSLASGSPLLLGKHLVKKAVVKGVHHAISKHIHAKSAAHHKVHQVQEVHYVAHPPHAVQYVPVVPAHHSSHSHGAYKQY